ncbi:FGGY-family carbohydrate kinase [Prosthecomicrobium pneumaticum]|uniref:Sugar (Pentulose or hexulose) kinase n=1 Tax=Prosthecomicrobium pneumaticum TaxID=81895 RepID=A0A7W9FJJ8_9HYPH|nr:FGGY-family carbohydrate kinase [Prosthecomicrobium pneumaticum]MBB5751661.1 sugar (pentulose or hexulose) kinase [Prosthecomicrobium pneumaticum]
MDKGSIEERIVGGYVLGIDVGTSMTKAALFDRAGREVGSAGRRTALRSPYPGWFEMEAEELYGAAAFACRTVVAETGVAPADVEGLAISGVMIGGWPVDAGGAVLRPGILWNDGRAQTLLDRRVAADPALMAKLFDSSGQVMQLGCTLPVLAWLAENEPQTIARARTILCAKDYLRLRLTGHVGTDETDSAIAPGSARERRFNPALLDLFGIGHLAHLLPAVARSEAMVGGLTVGAAAALGLPAGTPVAVGAGDLPACVIGAGAVEPGIAVSVVGTTCLNGVVADEPVFTPRDMGILFTVPGDLWIKTMVNVAGTTNLDWALAALTPDIAGRPDAYERLAEIAAESPAGAAGLGYVPYLSHIGIIAPRLEPGARAGFFGLDPDHRRPHLVRAVYEGLAYAIRDCYARIGRPVSAIRLVGGAARSPFWAQMIADVTGTPVEVPEGSEFGAKGAALLAAVAVGWFPDVRTAAAASHRTRRRFEPDAAPAAAYDAGFERFRRASDALLDGVAPAYRPKPAVSL